MRVTLRAADFPTFFCGIELAAPTHIPTLRWESQPHAFLPERQQIFSSQLPRQVTSKRTGAEVGRVPLHSTHISARHDKAAGKGTTTEQTHGAHPDKKAVWSPFHVEYRSFVYSDWFQTGCLAECLVHATSTAFTVIPSPTIVVAK